MCSRATEGGKHVIRKFGRVKSPCIDLFRNVHRVMLKVPCLSYSLLCGLSCCFFFFSFICFITTKNQKCGKVRVFSSCNSPVLFAISRPLYVAYFEADNVVKMCCREV